MTLSFPRRFAAFALIASAGACTLTADDYTPRPVAGEDSESTTPAAEGSGAQPAREASTGAPEEPAAGTLTEGPAPDLLAGGEDPAEAAASAELDAGARDGGALVPALPELVGWASVAGLGLETTTGGGTTPAVLVQTAEELIELAGRPEPLTLGIAGALDVGRLDVTSDKTLFGTNASATLRGGIAVRGTAERFVRNVIVHNLNIEASTSSVGGDGIEIRYAHHVWVDHCKLSDAADGLLDIVRGSDFVTVSRNRFLYTAAAPDPAHRFAALVGHDAANAIEDQGHLNVTWHHNWWSDDVTRALLGRFGRLHLFNNLFASSGNSSVLEADVGARLLVENNVFAGVASPHAILAGASGSVEAPGNVYVNTTGARDVAGAAFVPPYAYELEPALEPLATSDIGPQ